MRSSRKALVVFATAILLGAASPARGETLTIGVIGALTGPGAPWGKAAAGGARLAAAEVNARGGLVAGGKKYTVKVVAYDDKYNANEAVAAYSRLVKQDGVRFVIMFASASTLALKQSIENDEVLALTASHTKKALDPATKHMFRISSTANDWVPYFIGWLRDNIRERRVVIINPNDETGWDQSELCKRVYGEKGFQVLGAELFERSVVDFQPMLTKVLALKPEIIEIASTSPGTAGLIVRQARELGFQGRFTKVSGPGPKDIVGAAGTKAAEGVIQMLNGDPGSAGYRKLIADYAAAEGHEPNDNIIFFYDGPRILLKAIETAGTVDDVNRVAAAFSKVLPLRSVLGDELKLGGKAAYGVDAQVMTPAYIAETHDGGVVIRGKVQPK